MVSCEAFSWAAPLNGNAESALGDAITRFNGSLVLIEFKRDVDARDSEHEKYSLEQDPDARRKAYAAAQLEMSGHPALNAHGLIFGYDSRGDLGLLATAYWGHEMTPNVINWCYDNGANQTEFDDYLDKLSKLRCAISSSTEGSGGSRSFVVGVAKSGRCVAMELDDYINLRPALKRQLKLEVDSQLELNITTPSVPGW